jgi:hypothetical protein
VIWNVEPRPGLGGRLFKLLGLTKNEPQIPKVVRLRKIKDKAALARFSSRGGRSSTSIGSSHRTARS